MSVARRNKATKYCIDEVTRNINYSILVSLLITKAGGGEGGGSRASGRAFAFKFIRIGLDGKIIKNDTK